MSVIRKEFKTNGTTIDQYMDLLTKDNYRSRICDVLNQKKISYEFDKKLPTD
jgi:hypothetical protein